MQPLNNPLAINLHWEIVRYLRIPYFEAANFGDTGIQAEDHIERMLTLIEAGNAEKAVEVMQAFNRDGPRVFIQWNKSHSNGRFTGSIRSFAIHWLRN